MYGTARLCSATLANYYGEPDFVTQLRGTEVRSINGRRSFSRVSDDQRIQAILIAFAFGALIEALAGFGTPVAVTSVMLMALGFNPIKVAVLALVANTAPVAFGAMATPIITLGKVTELPADTLGAMVGRQTRTCRGRRGRRG
jgi:L-lactate permease